MPKCAHHVTGTKYKDCSEIKEVDPTCDSKCPGNNADYNSDKHRASSSYSLSSIAAIK
jgi:hypothetical protein